MPKPHFISSEDFKDYSTSVVFASDSCYRRYGSEGSKKLEIVTFFDYVAGEMSVQYNVYSNRNLITSTSNLEVAIKDYNNC